MSEANVLFWVCSNHTVGEKYILTRIDFPRIYKMLLNTRAEDKTQEDTEIREIE